MTPDQIRIVQTTWLRLLPIQETAAQLFYDRLFELDPTLRGLFRGDLRAQGKKLMQVIDGAVNGLTRIEKVVPIVQDLGRRHAGYGVKDHHYDTVGSALLWTLEKGLGAEFTEPVKAAWSAVYGMLADTMREAAAGAAHPVSALAPPAAAAGISTAARRSRISYLILVLGFAAAAGWGLNLTAGRAPQPGAARAPAYATVSEHPARFLLNVLLVPVLDAEAVPLRWVDPRRGMRCGPTTTIAVNGKPLAAGTLVPDLPFELEWHAEGCRPFGRYGPRIEGQVKLTVFREDWGFSAMIEPDQLRVVSANNQSVLIEAGAASLPRMADGDTSPKTAVRCDGGKLPCS